jgi:dihydroceramide fatty acyl 2-hydroxylase
MHKRLDESPMTDASIPNVSPLSRAEQLSDSPRIFANPIIDALSRAHWTTPLFYLIPVAYLLQEAAAQVAPLTLVLSVALGYVAWTLTEYTAHRHLFHWELPGELGARIHFLIHGIHHDHPSDPWRLVMPPLMSVPLIGVAWAVMSFAVGAPLKYPLMAGFVIGIVFYDELHFHLHIRRPTTRIGVWLRRVHMIHHFRDPERCFGVSAPYWDYLFGTSQRMPDEERTRNQH